MFTVLTQIINKTQTKISYLLKQEAADEVA